MTRESFEYLILVASFSGVCRMDVTILILPKKSPSRRSTCSRANARSQRRPHNPGSGSPLAIDTEQYHLWYHLQSTLVFIVAVSAL